MKQIIFATNNKEKLDIAQSICSTAHIAVVCASVDISEIQGEDPKIIIFDKARRTYEKIGKPVVVSDDSWNIPALSGFPGPYMKSVNSWFKPRDFIRLMQGAEDRTIILHQLLVYTDGTTVKLFENDTFGKIVDCPAGDSKKTPLMQVFALDTDNNLTIAQALEQDRGVLKRRHNDRKDPWHNFVEWYTKDE